MRKKILVISQCLMLAVLVIYALFSTQVFYDRVVKERFYALRIGSGFFEEQAFALDDGRGGYVQALRRVSRDVYERGRNGFRRQRTGRI